MFHRGGHTLMLWLGNDCTWIEKPFLHIFEVNRQCETVHLKRQACNWLINSGKKTSSLLEIVQTMHLWRSWSLSGSTMTWKSSVFEHVRTPTICDKGSAGEHFPKHELDHSQDDTHQAANNGHTEKEVILRETKNLTERKWESWFAYMLWSSTPGHSAGVPQVVILVPLSIITPVHPKIFETQ